jgi:DNA-binding NtrC family response regulator
MFGHEREAFTRRPVRAGLAQLAHRTIFLDEVAEMSRRSRWLLRVLWTEVRRWARPGVTVDARGNRTRPAAEVVRNFREDLYYRLNVIPVTTPRPRAAPDIPSSSATSSPRTMASGERQPVVSD